MDDPLKGLEGAIASLRTAWIGGAGGSAPYAFAASELDRARLVAVTEALGTVGRRLDAVRAQVAAEIDRQSRRELGADSLARQQGFRNASTLIAATTGISTGDAARLTRVGKAVAPRVALTGEPLPPKHPHVAASVAAGMITAQAAEMIVAMLERVALRAALKDRDEAEQILATQAPGRPLDDIRQLVARAEAWLDPDGLEPKERDRRGERRLRLWERDGMLHVDGALDIVSAAPLKAAIEGLVTAGFRNAKDDVTVADDAARLTVPQLQADALIQLAEHALSCHSRDLPLDGVNVIVRVSLEDLRADDPVGDGSSRSGCGSGDGRGDGRSDGSGADANGTVRTARLAEIDGITQPISLPAARLMASSAGIIPCVLGGAGEILDWGRVKRLFTPAQKLALVERDGGCAMCHLPPGMTKAHHIRWWSRDAGPTDLSNGILLCESCHHRIHDNGWSIRIDGTGTRAHVWFIPPPTADPARTPRLGGRARFDYGRAA